MKINFQEYGTTGKPVVLLHAFPLSGEMWKPQIDALKNKNVRLIVPDLRGFGESHSFSDINTMEDMAQDIYELLETLKIKKAILGGLSMGGYILFNFLKKFPEKAAALIFCDTHPANDSDETRRGRMDLIEKIETDGSDALIENMLPKLVGEHTKQNKPELVENLREKFSKVNPKAAIAALRGMAQRKDNTDLLKRISLPTLLIFGEEDKVTNLELASKMEQAITGSRLVIIPDSGHYSNLEQPENFNQAFVDFINAVEL